LEDGIELGLQDVDVDPAGVPELAEGILPELADVEDDAGEVGVGEAPEVDDLDPGIGLPGSGCWEQGPGEEEGEQERDPGRAFRAQACGCGFQFISIL
jgi:hypothetical protein